MLISDAYAQAAAAQPGGDFLTTMPMIVMIFALFYFIVIRPQSKRGKEQKLMIEALQKGDEVVTSGGILGRVVKISGTYIVLEIAANTEINVLKTSIQTLLPKGTLKTVEKD
jgi:preprotein translocase subunit YajC